MIAYTDRKRNPITKDEENFPIAFSLLVYHNFDQIEQLFMSIYRRQNFYCFHVDASSHSAFKRKIAQLAKCFPNNVVVDSQPVDVKYGTISILEAEFRCMTSLIKDLNLYLTTDPPLFQQEWKYSINLTGEELPLFTNLELVEVLRKLRGANVLDGPEYINSLQWFPKTLPRGLSKFKSSAHFVLSFEAVTFLVNDPTQVVSELFEAFSPHNFPEEAIIAILQYNWQVGFPGGRKRETNAKTILGPEYINSLQWFPKTLPRGLSKFKSSAHFVLSFEAVTFLVNDPTQVVSELFEAFSPHNFPEEAIIAILQYNWQVWRTNSTGSKYGWKIMVEDQICVPVEKFDTISAYLEYDHYHFSQTNQLGDTCL
ncbi:beta-1,3-galactosyl-O-glycosyl-glycoprotein beta-1,6-N-acetylglucosaminyltransferase 4-like [Symsagittifera roscoffensis]|uniref:beta-1,3-galactosyl-O-glycosyl-glycoprotein beta-1,6-N-acetylglucosaminyltransferase 4-like n=1 Tax=Symsagittifera roscoffensis TaxID=84072 RepID=UPI00307C1AAE